MYTVELYNEFTEFQLNRTNVENFEKCCLSTIKCLTEGICQSIHIRFRNMEINAYLESHEHSVDICLIKIIILLLLLNLLFDFAHVDVIRSL